MSDPTTSDRNSIDDAIDRTVRDMTHVAADDDAVARVMARVRQADARDAGARDASAVAPQRWRVTPRVAWAGVAALLLIAFLTSYAMRSFNRGVDERRVAVTVSAQPSKQPQPLAAREIPTRVMVTPSTVQATTARVAHRDMAVKPSSVANGAADAGDRRDAQPELPPLESDLVIASIAPAPLGDAPAILVAPLVTPALLMDAIPVPSIDMPPAGPEPQR